MTHFFFGLLWPLSHMQITFYLRLFKTLPSVHLCGHMTSHSNSCTPKNNGGLLVGLHVLSTARTCARKTSDDKQIINKTDNGYNKL